MNNEETEETCCYCGKPESDMGGFKSTCPDGHLICSGWCQTGLACDVD